MAYWWVPIVASAVGGLISGAMSKRAARRAGHVPIEAIPRPEFRPFTISTQFGTVRPSGPQSLSVELSPDVQRELDLVQREQTGLLSGLSDSIQGGPDEALIARYGGLLSQLREPLLEETRARLESRAKAQGRLGLDIGVGGTPEMRAFEQEAARMRQTDALQAIQLGESARRFNIEARLNAIQNLSQHAARLRDIAKELLGQSLAFSLGDLDAQSRYTASIASMYSAAHGANAETSRWAADVFSRIIRDVFTTAGTTMMGQGS